MLASLKKAIALLVIHLLVLPLGNADLLVTAAHASETTKIVHKPVKSAISGKRLELLVKVEDPAGIDVVRVYFKAADVKNYHFVPLTGGKAADGLPVVSDEFRGQLPAPARGPAVYEYLILVKNGEKVVVKSQPFTFNVEAGEGAPATPAADRLQVYTEVTENLTEITGFADNIAIDVVESGAKFGAVAGLYSLASGGSTADATGGGTVIATTGESTSTGLIIGSAVAVAAIVGGALALSSGGSDSGSSDNTTPTSPPAQTCSFVGNWAGAYSGLDCAGSPVSGSWTGNVDSACLFTLTSSSIDMDGTIDEATNEASMAGTLQGCGGLGGTALFQGSSVSITATGATGADLSMTGRQQ